MSLRRKVLLSVIISGIGFFIGLAAYLVNKELNTSLSGNRKVVELILRKYQNIISQDLKNFQAHFEGFREVQEQLQFAQLLNNFDEVRHSLDLYSKSSVKLNDQLHNFDTIFVLNSQVSVNLQTGSKILSLERLKTLMRMGSSYRESGFEFNTELSKFHLYRTFQVEGQGRFQISVLLSESAILQRLAELKVELSQYELYDAKVALYSGFHHFSNDSDWKFNKTYNRETILQEEGERLISQVFVLFPSTISFIVCDLPRSLVYDRIYNTLAVLLVYTLLLWLILVIMLSSMMNHLVLRPLQLLKNQSDRIAKGEFAQRIDFTTDDEVAALAKSFNSMAHNIELGQQQLREFNRNLQNLVNQKTEAIQNLLDTTGQGFLTFQSNFEIGDQYSKMCLEIFRKSELKGESVAQLLYPNSPNLREEFVQWMSHVFDNKLHPKFIIELAPQSFEVHSNIYSIEYRFYGGVDDSKPREVLLILTDITQEVELKRVVEEEQSFMRMVVQTLEHPLEFHKLRNGIRSIKAHPELYLEKSSNLLFMIHGLKGNAASFEMFEVASKLHELEDLLQNLASSRREREIRIKLEEIDDELDRIVRRLSRIIPISEEELLSIHIPPELYEQVLSHLKQTQDELALKMQSLALKPISRLLASLQMEAEGICVRRQKLIDPIEFIGQVDLMVHPQSFSFILECLEHLLRNSIDHGIEPVQERQKLGKTPQGKIRIEFSQKENDLLIQFSDDGKGLNLDRILSIAIDHGLIDHTSLNKEQISQLIFEEGFSTSNEVDRVSGRGIGLSGVKKVLHESNSTIEVVSKDGSGVEFQLQIKDFFTYSQDPSRHHLVAGTES